jgi:hypothetical protein
MTLSGPSPTRTATRPASTATRTPPGGSPTRTPTNGASPTRTRTATATAAAASGPVISFLGVVRADNRYNAADLIGITGDGTPIYRRPLGTGFVIVVEARPGSSRRNVGQSSFNSDPGDPRTRPDLQIVVDRALGNGSAAVCDNEPPDIGGVPAVKPPRFDETQAISNAINDLACRFVDGEGQPRARNRMNACVLFEDGEYGFFDSSSTAQYCSVVIPQAMRFGDGDTLVLVRVRDAGGNSGPPARMIIRVGG